MTREEFQEFVSNNVYQLKKDVDAALIEQENEKLIYQYNERYWAGFFEAAEDRVEKIAFIEWDASKRKWLLKAMKENFSYLMRREPIDEAFLSNDEESAWVRERGLDWWEGLFDGEIVWDEVIYTLLDWYDVWYVSDREDENVNLEKFMAKKVAGYRKYVSDAFEGADFFKADLIREHDERYWEGFFQAVDDCLDYLYLASDDAALKEHQKKQVVYDLDYKKSVEIVLSGGCVINDELSQFMRERGDIYWEGYFEGKEIWRNIVFLLEDFYVYFRSLS